jgi:sugar lactone lactonase YvrE
LASDDSPVKITKLEIPACRVGEGPVWDVAEQALYYLDVFGKKLHRYHPGTGDVCSWDTRRSIGAFALRTQGDAVVALKDGVYAFDLQSSALTPFASYEKQNPRARLNDGKVDRRGRFIVGAADTEIEQAQTVGAVYSLGADRVITRYDDDIYLSNGPCWSPDSKTLYFSDSFRYTTFAYDYDLETGRIANRRPFVDTRPLGGMPDGATVDSDGLVWMAIFKGGKVVAFRPDGKVERIVPMPISTTSSVMFGGPQLDRLYVTTLDPTFYGAPAEDGGGSPYVIEGLGARGLPEPRYAG